MRKDEPEASAVVLMLLLFLIISALFWYRDGAMVAACQKSGETTDHCNDILK